MKTNLYTDKTTGCICLKLEGDLTVKYANQLKEALIKTLDSPDDPVLDLNGACEFDLSCVQLLYAFHLAAEELNKPVTLSTGCPQLFKDMVMRAGYAELIWFGSKKEN